MLLWLPHKSYLTTLHHLMWPHYDMPCDVTTLPYLMWPHCIMSCDHTAACHVTAIHFVIWPYHTTPYLIHTQFQWQIQNLRGGGGRGKKDSPLYATICFPNLDDRPLGCIVLTLLGQANFIFEPVSMVSEQKTTTLICFHCTTPLVLNMTLFP